MQQCLQRLFNLSWYIDVGPTNVACLSGTVPLVMYQKCCDSIRWFIQLALCSLNNVLICSSVCTRQASNICRTDINISRYVVYFRYITNFGTNGTPWMYIACSVYVVCRPASTHLVLPLTYHCANLIPRLNLCDFSVNGSPGDEVVMT